MEIFCQGKKVFLSPSVKCAIQPRKGRGLSFKEDFKHTVLIPLFSCIQLEGGF